MVEKYVAGRRKCFRLCKVYIFLIRVNSRVHLIMSACPTVNHVRMNAEIIGTIKPRRLRLSIQILETNTQRKLVDYVATPTVTPTLLNIMRKNGRFVLVRVEVVKSFVSN